MTDSPSSNFDVKDALVNQYQLSGDDLEATVKLIEKNMVEFCQALRGLAGKEEWSEISFGGGRCKALGENLGWQALAEVGVAIEQGANEKSRLAVTRAGKKLHDLTARITHDPSATAPTIRFKLD